MAALARIPFTPQTESVIRQMAGWMLFVAIVHFVLGLLVSLAGFGGGATVLVAIGGGGGVEFLIALFLVLVYGSLGLVMLLEGILLVRARSALGAVVDSDTNDQEHLSAALRRLEVFFYVEIVLGLLSLLGSVLQIGVALFAPALQHMGALSQVGS